MSTIFYGALVTPVSLTAYRALPRALLAVSRETGDIDWVEDDVPAGELQEVLAKHGVVSEGAEIVELKTGEFLMPGFIDTHIVSRASGLVARPSADILLQHAPQVPNTGRCALR